MTKELHVKILSFTFLVPEDLNIKYYFMIYTLVAISSLLNWKFFTQLVLGTKLTGTTTVEYGTLLPKRNSASSILRLNI